jgi:Na+-transporting methylmalonyl-CoA/oxaloacetate decarboxylase gamma subunit
MTTTTFGITLLVVGMGGTLATLWLLAGCLKLLTKLFPADEVDGDENGGPGRV